AAGDPAAARRRYGAGGAPGGSDRGPPSVSASASVASLGRWSLALGPKDRGGLRALGAQDGRLLLALGGQDLRLLDALGGEDRRAAVALGAHLLLHRLLHRAGRLDRLELNPVDTDAPATRCLVEHRAQRV